MQIELQRILVGSSNQMNKADDIMIGGTVEGHDSALFEVCSKLKKEGITLNPKKCIFYVNGVTFMGLVFSVTGIKPDPKNIKNLNEAETPRNQAEFCSFFRNNRF